MSAALSLILAPVTNAAPFAYVPNSQGRTISVVDIATNRVRKTIAVSGEPVGIGIDPVKPRAYVASFPDTLWILDTDSKAIVGSLFVGQMPREVAFLPDGAIAFVTMQGGRSVAVIDAETDSLLGQIDVGDNPTSIAIAPDGSTVYVVTDVIGSVVLIDAGSQSVITTIPLAGIPGGVAISPTDDVAYVATQSSRGISVLDTGSRTIVGTIETGQDSTNVAFSPDGTIAFASNTASNTVSVLDPHSASVIGPPIPVGLAPYGLAFTSDSRIAYVVNQCGDDSRCRRGSVSVIDVATANVKDTIPLGYHPGLIAIDKSSAPVCGDGIVEPPEQCDDGNPRDGDGCAATCEVEPGFACSGEPSTCRRRCPEALPRLGVAGSNADSAAVTTRCERLPHSLAH